MGINCTLEGRDLFFRYGSKDDWLIENLSFSMSNEDCVGLFAPSGFGKTTLCKILSGYLNPQKGQVLVDGKDIFKIKGYCPVQMIWQQQDRAVNGLMTMGQVLEEGGSIPETVLEGLGIDEKWYSRYPQELSGGELQRFCIARAMGEQTRILIADEITTMMDAINQNQIWHFLKRETEQRGIGMVIVSHDEYLLNNLCDKIIKL